ncbi:MAG: hypothetical protein KDC44_01835 [Phaeodactylibacter sp.]|nr:hypothetical protein [Phaeodactylibacter sp.]
MSNQDKTSWFQVKVREGQEEETVKNLLAAFKTQNLEAQLKDVFVPFGDYGKGRVCVQLELNQTTKEAVESTAGVVGFVGGNILKPLNRKELLQLQGYDELQGNPRRAENAFEVGGTVTIVEGPFQNLKATIKEVDAANQKLKLTVTIFGRSTETELGFTQVE